MIFRIEGTSLNNKRITLSNDNINNNNVVFHTQRNDSMLMSITSLLDFFFLQGQSEFIKVNLL